MGQKDFGQTTACLHAELMLACLLRWQSSAGASILGGGRISRHLPGAAGAFLHHLYLPQTISEQLDFGAVAALAALTYFAPQSQYLDPRYGFLWRLLNLCTGYAMRR